MIRRVSSSGRTCGRPRQRRSRVVSISAMLLHDACHSIDSPNVGPILENIKFPNYADLKGVTTMTRHSTAFEIERPVPAGEAARDLRPAAPGEADAPAAAPAPAAAKKFNFRKLLMASVAVAVLAG